jgi:hypothetical protein
MSSHAYYVGIFCADMILFTIPCSLVVIVAFIFNIASFTENAGSILLELVVFGLSYMQFNYLFGFMFSKVEAAFKYQIFPMMVLFASPYLI